MKRLVLFFALVLLTGIVPVYAQTATPNAPNIPSSVVRDVAEATQTLGVMTVVILVALAVLVGIVVFFIIGALRVSAPLLTTIQKLIASRDDLQRETDEKERRQDEYRAQTAQSMKLAAEAQERTVNVLLNLETRKEAQDGRKTAVETITEHTDGALKPLAEQIDGIIKLLVADQQEQARRANALDGKVDEAIRELRQLKTAILKGDTNPLDPSKVPDTDPATPAPNAAADVWQGDHPEKHEGD